MAATLTSPQSCDERGEAVAYDGDVDEDILHIAPLARFLRSSHNFKPKPEGLEIDDAVLRTSPA